MKYKFVEEFDPNGTQGKILAQVKPGSVVLECGCASGYMTKFMKEQLGCKVYIVEYSYEGFCNAIQYAEDGICGDLMAVEWTEKFTDILFDYVMFADVLEHLSDPQKAVNAAAAMMKDSGEMLISLPNIGHNDIVVKLLTGNWDYTPTGLLDNTHIHFWGINNLEAFFAQAGLIITLKDCVQADTAHTEQYDCCNFPEDERIYAAIKDRNEGEVYQFVLTLQKSEHVRKHGIPKIDKIPHKGSISLTAGSLKDLQQELVNKEGHIQLLLQSERDLQAQLSAEKQRYVEEYQRLTEEKDAELQHMVEAKDVEFQNMVAEKDAILAQQATALTEKDALLKEQSAAIAEKNAVLAQQAATLDEKKAALAQQAAALEEKNAALVQQAAELAEKNQTIRNQEGHIAQLLEPERELERIKASRSWRFMGYVWKIESILAPTGSRRRLFGKMLIKFVKHPVRFLSKCTPKRIGKFFRYLRTEGVERVGRHLDDCLVGTDIQTQAIEITPVAKATVKTAADYATISVPQWETPQVSIVIPAYNQFDYTYQCVRSVVDNSGDIPYEIILADDCSTDLTREIQQVISGLVVVRNQENLRFLKNCNHAAKEARGEYILFLNNDTQVQQNWLAPLVELMERDSHIGMVGSKLVYPDGRLQEAGGILWRDGSAWNYGNRSDPALPEFNYVKEADYISGASIMIRRTLWEEIGGFDERFAPAYCEDSDLAFTVRKLDYKVMYQPLSVVVHFEGISNGTDLHSGQKAYQLANQEKFCKKWREVLEQDHFKNGENVFLARDRSAGKKVLLMIDHYVPMYDKDAGSRTIYQYIQLLTRIGYYVKFIGDNFYAHQPYTRQLEQMGVEVLYGPYYVSHWKEWIKENARVFSVAIISRPHIAEKYIDFIKANTNARIIYNLSDLHFLRERREYEVTGDPALLRSSEEWKRKEFRLMELADTVYTLSTLEQSIIDKHIQPKKTELCPIFIYDNFVKYLSARERTQDLLFVGGFNHRPNVDAMHWFCLEVFPLIQQEIPEIRLHIVGSNPTSEIQKYASERIIIEGFVTEEALTEFYRTCRVCVIPLRYGAGVKGKTIEAMYYGIPIVTTSVGIEGLAGIEDCLIASDTAEEFAARTVSVYRGDTSDMVQACYGYVRSRYSREAAEEFFKRSLRPRED